MTEKSNIKDENSIDLILLNKILQKDCDAFSEFYDIHCTNIYSMIIQLIEDEKEAENILKEVFLQIWEKASHYEENLCNPISWLTRIARVKCFDRLRSRSLDNIENYKEPEGKDNLLLNTE